MDTTSGQQPPPQPAAAWASWHILAGKQRVMPASKGTTDRPSPPLPTATRDAIGLQRDGLDWSAGSAWMRVVIAIRDVCIFKISYDGIQASSAFLRHLLASPVLHPPCPFVLQARQQGLSAMSHCAVLEYFSTTLGIAMFLLIATRCHCAHLFFLITFFGP